MYFEKMKATALVLGLFLSAASFSYASSYPCQNDTQCGNGTCAQDFTCACHDGFGDDVQNPCSHEFITSDRLPPFMLELFLGWGFPAGTAYLGMWEMVGVRLGLEVLAGGLFGGYLATKEHSIRQIRREDKKTKALFAGAVTTGFFHAGLWIAGATFFGELYHQDAVTRAITHKDKGEADLVVMGSKIAESARITLNTFAADSCALVEECIDGDGERRLLRFDSWIHNRGEGDFVMAFENVAPVWSDCHAHYHGPDTAEYVLLQELTDADGQTVISSTYGHKQGYCYIDSERIFGDYPRKYSCGVARLTRQYTQGITAGWADIYHGSLDCQWIDITGLAPGEYQLKVTINPKGTYSQDVNLTNNIAIVNVTVPPQDDAVERTSDGQPISACVVHDYNM